MCGDRKKPKMLDRKMRGSHDLEVRLYELMKQADLDKEEIQRLNLIIKKLEEDLENVHKSVN
jgi:tRNA C32,U32 (ribose-2'-O)-methylase TrmJ